MNWYTQQLLIDLAPVFIGASFLILMWRTEWKSSAQH